MLDVLNLPDGRYLQDITTRCLRGHNNEVIGPLASLPIECHRCALSNVAHSVFFNIKYFEIVLLIEFVWVFRW